MQLEAPSFDPRSSERSLHETRALANYAIVSSATAGVLSKLLEFHLFYANFQSNLIPTAFHFHFIHNVFSRNFMPFTFGE